MSRLRLMSLETLLEKKENEEPLVIIDALSAESYAKGHIPGAINLSADPELTAEEYGKKAEEAGVKKDDAITTYCANYGCHASTRAARALMAAGFTDVYDFKAGKKGWVDGGLDLES